VPEQLDQVASTPAEAENLAGMRIAPEPLLDLESERGHPAPHVRHPACDPHAQGACLFSKRLEKGRFVWPSAKEGKIALTPAQSYGRNWVMG
jgi:hypothetical protein